MVERGEATAAGGSGDAAGVEERSGGIWDDERFIIYCFYWDADCRHSRRGTTVCESAAFFDGIVAVGVGAVLVCGFVFRGGGGVESFCVDEDSAEGERGVGFGVRVWLAGEFAEVLGVCGNTWAKAG